jgi:hypothetical protein
VEKDMKKFPQAKQIAWPSFVIQIGWLILFMAAAAILGKNAPLAPMAGAVVFLVVYFIIKLFLERPLTNGMKLVNQGEFRQAIVRFEQAYDFLLAIAGSTAPAIS